MNELKEGGNEPIFVIGFPKSGNTWLARLLAEVTRSNIAVNNPLDGVNMADNSSERKGRYIIHKEHVVMDVEKVLQGKVVYIVRDVRDVLVSGFFFSNPFVCEDWVRINRKCPGIRGRMYRAYFQHQIRRMNKFWRGNELSELMNRINGDKNIVGSWSEHIKFWTKNPSVVVVRYEDLLQNTVYELKDVIDSLQIDVSDEALKEAISNQSFKKKKTEFMNAGDSLNTKFLRRGKAGAWREFLSPAIVEEIERTHAHVMNKYGYKLEYYEGDK